MSAGHRWRESFSTRFGTSWCGTSHTRQIPRATRAERHEQVAEWIERHVRSEDAAELLAHHYSNALEYGRAAGRDVSEVIRRARVALRDAGRRAVALNSFVNAARFFEAAVELTPEDDPDWPRLVLEQAEASVYVDLSSDRRLRSAREVLLAGDVHDAGRAEVVLGEYRWLRGDQAGSNEHFIAAGGLAERMTDENVKLRVLANLGRFAMLGDENERAVALGRPALALAEKLGRDEMRAHVLNNIGVARVALGEREGLDDLEASLEIARGVGGPEYVRACGNLASVLACEGQLQRSAELHREGLQISQEIGYEEPTRWLLTEIANDHMLAGNWAEARRIVDELMPAYEESPFWIEPQTRVCRARMLIAEGAVEDAVVDADRAVAVVEGKSTFQGLCNPLALRARLHAELGETKDAARVTAELLDVWKETRSAYVESWVLDLWFAAWSAGEEARLTTAVGEFPIAVPWLDVVSAFIERDFDQGRRPAGVDGLPSRPPPRPGCGRASGWSKRASRGRRCAARARASFLAFGRRVAVSPQVRVVARCRVLEPPVVRRTRTRVGHVPPRGPRDRSASARLRGRGARVASRLSGCCRPPGRPDATEAHAWSRGRVLRGAARRDRCRRTCGRIPPGLSECARQSVPCDFAAVRS